MSNAIPMATIADFNKIEIRVGRVTEVTPFPDGKSSTHILQVDFGPAIGTRKSLARLSPNYTGSELVDRQVLALVNIAARQIGPHRSEVLTLGLPDEHGNVVLIQPERDVPLGGRLY